MFDLSSEWRLSYTILSIISCISISILGFTTFGSILSFLLEFFLGHAYRFLQLFQVILACTQLSEVMDQSKLKEVEKM